MAREVYVTLGMTRRLRRQVERWKRARFRPPDEIVERAVRVGAVVYSGGRAIRSVRR